MALNREANRNDFKIDFVKAQWDDRVQARETAGNKKSTDLFIHWPSGDGGNSPTQKPRLNADDLARVDATVRQMTEQVLAGGDFSKVLELEPEPVDGKRVPRRIFNPYDQHETFRALAQDPRLLDKIESLIGGDFNLQHSKLNMKPAKVGSVVEWHQFVSVRGITRRTTLEGYEC